MRKNFKESVKCVDIVMILKNVVRCEYKTLGAMLYRLTAHNPIRRRIDVITITDERHTITRVNANITANRLNKIRAQTENYSSFG